ncbi:class I SAM-dependent methyltransferase [Xanthocytophaga agilis]|uniref:class I SAM-dependent methyltransferase n=1 Tax=Xanthocytophaga agilis TaxID=3048010 RepID=UPI0028D12BB7|nr:methyltransferase domain-containing protein [Xanthocytophaga agilis]
MGALNYRYNVKFSTHIINFDNIPQLWTCKNCYSGFTQNAITQTDAETLYSTGNGTLRWSGTKFEDDKPKEVSSFFNTFLKNGMKVMDIGCNTGEFLDFVKDKKCIPYGIELSKDSREVVLDKGYKCYSDFTNIDEVFDVITAFDLFEHLYQPNSLINFCKKKLKKEGLLIIFTGNIGSINAKLAKNKWWYTNYPEHVLFASRKYYSQLDNFSISTYLKTYASQSHEALHNNSSFLNTIKNILQGKFTGNPALFKDHHLIALKHMP